LGDSVRHLRNVCFWMRGATGQLNIPLRALPELLQAVPVEQRVSARF